MQIEQTLLLSPYGQEKPVSVHPVTSGHCRSPQLGTIRATYHTGAGTRFIYFCGSRNYLTIIEYWFLLIFTCLLKPNPFVQFMYIFLKFLSIFLFVFIAIYVSINRYQRFIKMSSNCKIHKWIINRYRIVWKVPKLLDHITILLLNAKDLIRNLESLIVYYIFLFRIRKHCKNNPRLRMDLKCP